MQIDPDSGVSNHVDENGCIDYEIDANHVAILELEQESVPYGFV
jgi:hypothetical protein